MKQGTSLSLLACLVAGGFLALVLGRAVVSSSLFDSGPRVELSPLKVDLGSVPAGRDVKSVFHLRNVGDSRLLILDIKASCQCTVPALPSRVVAPKASEALTVVFNGRSTGRKVQQVVVKTNDRQKPAVVLTLVAEVSAVAETEAGQGTAIAAREKAER